MCESNQHTWVYPDGRRKKQPLETVYLCPNARHGRPCTENTIYRHPARPAPSYSTSAPSPSSMSPSSSPAAFLLPTQFPPTPNYTPRSGTPNYYSGNDSDRSHHSTGSGSAPRRTRSHRTPRVYINGQEVYRSPSPSRSRDRYVLASSSSSHTPPQPTSRIPHSAPNSPSSPYVFETSNHRRTSSFTHQNTQRPVVVHERPHVEFDIREPRRMHTRDPSSSSEDHSSSSSRQARSRRQQSRQERTADRIAQANAQIANRPVVPRASGHRAPEPLADAMRRMDLNDEARERKRQARREEKEAAQQQTERLRERLSRRATVQYGEEGRYR
ncbi:uncharacterized protein J7T54_006990 [Emericellopsis cladophorae]|uniref:Uncharacterized protein n=1 Tax=Emericellopsis cladophorae TaxID=2686198 RepID=A0A9P9Y926_9HYPO|nr:uncharacterized protein J7T54_006990 [Emericellopsis cladophorae]KAI6785348.1 hypothetical protein J7T54_006990 [Emericellopsis cladophorae]